MKAKRCFCCDHKTVIINKEGMTYGIGCVRPVAVINIKFHFNKFKLASIGRELNSLCLDLKAFERRLT